MELFTVNDEGSSRDSVGAGAHDGAEAAGVEQIMLHIVVAQNDIFHIHVSVRRLKADKDSSQVCHRRAQAVCPDRVQRNFCSVTESAKIFLRYAHSSSSFSAGSRRDIVLFFAAVLFCVIVMLCAEVLFRAAVLFRAEVLFRATVLFCPPAL